MHDPAADLSPAVERDIDLGVSSVEQLDAVPRGAAVQLKLDTGLGRNGAPPAEWPAFLAAASAAQRAGRVRVRGLWSHLAGVDDEVQVDAFTAGLEAAHDAGLDPEHTHLAASAAAQTLPGARFSLVRFGIAAYGLGATHLPLRPSMTLEGTVISAKRVTAGTGVSYGHEHVTDRETTLALVPLGYADGVPRHASGRGPVRIGDRTFTVAGRVAMDQIVVDVGDAPVRAGDRAVLFGDPATGAPGAADWADAAGTIDYEIVTRIGPRVPREYVDAG
jgi:alanine racemase